MTSTLLHNLNSLAVIPPSNNWSHKSWLNLALHCLKRGLNSEKVNDIQSAYIEYLKLTRLVLEILPGKINYSNYNTIDNEVYTKLKKVVTEKLPLIEKWKQLFIKAYNSSKTMQNSANDSNVPNNVAINAPTKPPPAIPDKKSVNSANGANTQSPDPDIEAASAYNTINAISNPQMHKTPTGVTYTSPTTFQLPEKEYITKHELGKLWSQSKEGTSNPSILFIDLRLRDQFEQNTIKGSNIVNIDLTEIKPHISAKEIEAYLSSRNLKMGHLFSSRHTFDCIIMYDQESEYIQASSMINEQVSHCTIYDIKLAIAEHGYSKKIHKAPYFLIGGLKAWDSYLGDRGFIYHNSNKLPNISIQSTNGSSVKSNPELSATGAIGLARDKPILQNVSDFRSGQVSAIKAQESMMKPHSPEPSRLRSPTSEPMQISISSSNQSSERRRTIFDDHYYNFTGSPSIQEPAKLSHISPPIPMPVSSALSGHIGVTGLKNLGNTCFINSIIQCINGTSPLARYFLDGSYRKQINTVENMGYKGALAEEFGSLIRSLWNSQSSAISPSSFRVLVGTLNSQFKNYDQQDSQEFLAFLLDGLHEDLNLVIDRATLPDIDDDHFESLPDQQASDLAWNRYNQLNNSIIVNLFQGQLKSRLQCQACFKTSTSYNTFMYLSIPIPKLGKFHKSVALMDCLNSFVKEEVLDGDDAWICPRCKIHRKTIKQLSISRLPDILLIHLKRFSYEGPFRNRLDTMVDCPLMKLDLTKYIPTTSAKSSITDPNGKPLGHVYNLYAVSNHYGTLNGGHYTASVRNGYNGEWRYFDDSKISLINEKKVVTSAAYSLFYVRSNVNG